MDIRSRAAPRLLLVDGEPAVHRLIVRVFTGEGMEVVCVEDVVQALAVIREGGVDVVLTSGSRRPDGSTDPLLALRTGYPGLPILSLGNFDGPSSSPLCPGSPLWRPFSVERLVAAVRRTLHQVKSA